MGFFDFFSSKPTHMPPLRFHNTLSGEVEAFHPLSKREVKMYNCGPTVYDQVHIGNLRSYLFADLLRRVLEEWGYGVKQVINITDVGHLVGDGDLGEDKIEMGARKAGKKAQEIAQEITKLFFLDLEESGVERKRIAFPRATEYVAEQIALVKALEEKGYAYKITDGVYFDTAKFQSYGKLGNIDLEGLESGARVEENPEKKSAHDFALWKLSKKSEAREQEWPSPWGVGFPGWHIECTAIIFTLLGKQIDIHTGGIDHIPTHHNNEIAQAEAITARQYVRHWMHHDFITIEGKRIAKSLGNTIYLHQITDRGFSPRALRYWYLTGHYRSPMNFTWEAIEGANTALMRLYRFYFEELAHEQGGDVDERFITEFRAHIANDLDTPQALARVWELVKDDSIFPSVKRASLREADKILGLGFAGSQGSVRLNVNAIELADLPESVRELVEQRESARTTKDYTKADALRIELEQAGYLLKDTEKGPKISKK